MRVWVLGSGSSGNAAVIEADGARILIDAGMGPKTAARKMKDLGGDLFSSQLGLQAIVVTHHHGDHIAHLEPHARASRAPIYLHRGIDVLPRVREKYEVRPYEPGRPFTVGPFTIEALSIPHDAPQVSLRISTATHAFGVATDLGHVPRDLAAFLGSCDSVLLEANYDAQMLEWGPYPPRLKRRVAGDIGHLDNEQTAELAAALIGMRLRRIYLGHISRTNNTPDRALAAVRKRAGSLEVSIVFNGVPQLLDVVQRTTPAHCHPMTQLSLFGQGHSRLMQEPEGRATLA